jgi:hypothetical protein
LSDIASSLGRPVYTGLKKLKGLAPHPWTITERERERERERESFIRNITNERERERESFVGPHLGLPRRVVTFP